MNDIEQNASNSTPITHTTYPKVESPSPSLRSYTQWQGPLQGNSMSPRTNSSAPSNVYGSSFVSSLLAANDAYQTPQEYVPRLSLSIFSTSQAILHACFDTVDGAKCGCQWPTIVEFCLFRKMIALVLSFSSQLSRLRFRSIPFEELAWPTLPRNYFQLFSEFSTPLCEY